MGSILCFYQGIMSHFRGKNFCLLAAAIVCFGLAAGSAYSSNLSPAELRGRFIYRKGEIPSGQPITAVTGKTELKGKLVPCGSCHGLDGRGRAEGSVVPPSIRWEDLIRPRRLSGGRERNPYSEGLVVRAITMGLDSSENRLNAVMPRFALSQTDAQDLIAYLKQLSGDNDPGLSDDSVRIGSLLPPAVKYPGLSAAIQSALTAYFADVNKAGGLYGRRIDLISSELPPEREKMTATYREFLEKEQVFALVASYVAGAETQSSEILQEQKVPLVGAWTLLPETKPSSAAAVFYLDSGLPGQSEALVKFGLRKYATKGEKLAFVASDDALSQAAIAAARSQIEGSPWTKAADMKGPDDGVSADSLVQRLASAKVNVLFVALPENQLTELLHAIQRSGWKAVLLIPSALYKEIGGLQSFPGRIFFAIASLPSDVSPDASAEYQKLASDHGLSQRHLAAQFAAIAEARLLTEALERAGRSLSREQLLKSLNGLYDFSTGFSPSVTFSPARRIGITQFHIVQTDPASGSMIEVNEAQE
jgi:ABC-type branched-subunit amino acid transport system substrate-binding protein